MTINALPDDFTPGPRDVVIGKGKKFYFHAGNAWLRAVVGERIDEYRRAVSKADKSNLISAVLQYVIQNGQFVKQDFNQGGKWVYAEPLLCREKCSQTFRDYLAETYRSSNVAKRNKRREQRVGSSSDLINALQSAKISSSTSLKNLQKLQRHTMSMGNLLKPCRVSSGHFSAAKKASFAKINKNGNHVAVVTSGGTTGHQHHLNATWGPRRTSLNKSNPSGTTTTALGTMSSKLTEQLRANLKLQQQTMQLQADLQGLQMNQPQQQQQQSQGQTQGDSMIIQQLTRQQATTLPIMALPAVVESGGANLHQVQLPMQLPSLEPTPLREESSNSSTMVQSQTLPLPLPTQPSGLVDDFHKVDELEEMRIQLTAADWDGLSKTTTELTKQLGGDSDAEEEVLPNLIGSSTDSDNNDDFDAIVEDLLLEAGAEEEAPDVVPTGIDHSHNSHGSFDALLHMPIMECDLQLA